MILENREQAAPFHQARIKKLQKLVSASDIDALLVTNLENIRYLSGFSGTAATMLITDDKAFFLTDFRYTTQMKSQVTPGVITDETKEALGSVADILAAENIENLGIEAQNLTVARMNEMKKRFDNVTFIPVEKMVESIRIVKDTAEMEVIMTLMGMLDDVLPSAFDMMRPGMVERDVALELEYKLRQAGADGPAFDFIVASGERSAMPHGVASEKVIGKKEAVILDWGAKGWGYHTDNTRTTLPEDVEPQLKEIYKIVLDANLAAIDAIKPGVPLKKIDEAARDLITKAGYGDYFGHGTGHGIGLDIHEAPTVSWRSDQMAVEGMVFTIEPGIYIPRLGGVRIEDMVQVTANGAEVLSVTLPK